MSRQTDEGHEGWVAAVFADGTYGGGRPLHASWTADGKFLPPAQWQDRPADEVVGWRPTCVQLGVGHECWRGPTWTRVTDPDEHDPANHRIYNEDSALAPEDEDLLMREWEAHIAPTRGTAEIEFAAGEVDQAQRRLTEAVVEARAQGASWEAIGRAAGMSRQSAHERWAKVVAR